MSSTPSSVDEFNDVITMFQFFDEEAGNMAAEHIQKPDTVQCDPLIKSDNYVDIKKDESDVSIGEHGVSIKGLSNDVESKESVETDVNSGLVSHAESSTSLVDLESTANKTESKMPSLVSSKLQLQMEWSDTEEDTGQSIIGDCAKRSPEADGADYTLESTEDTVEPSPGAEATLELKVEPHKLKDEPTASEEVSKELPVEEPPALEVKRGEREDETGKAEEEEAAAGGGGEVDEEVVVVKPRKTRLECRECGKCFTRRETYNLHRHFHMHQDEQASLTCKECGLTFQHRSSLIKHRNEHKEKEKEKAESAPIVQAAPIASSDKKAFFKTANSQNDPQCEHCGKTFETLAKLRTHNCKLAPEKPYRCPLCRKEFQYRVSITSHMQTHSLEYSFRCLECNKGFQSAMSLRIHQRSHAALKPFACPECGMVFRHRSVMEDHRRRHTEERPYHCNLCGKCFKYASLLHQHQYLHTGKKPFRCRDCGKAFAFSQNLRAHMRQHQKHPRSCPHCLDTFSDEAKLQEHVATHEMSAVVDKENANYALEQPRLYNCPLCSQVYYRPADLRVHMLVHEAEFEGMSNGVKEAERTYACSRCPLTFSDEASLQSHVITHEASFMRRDVRGLGMGRRESMPGSGIYGDQIDKKPLKCRDCGRGFRHRSVLELHMRIHSKDKPYRCNECGKSFRFGSYLQQHLIIHTGKKPYKCPDCGKDFAFLQNMKTHQRLHQQKPFRCTQCRKGYSDEDQLQRHMLSHTGDKPHKCHLCHKSFGLAYLLRDHMNTHTGERPHRCQECNKSFQWLSSLLVHQKIHMRKHQDGKRGRKVSTYRPDWQRWDRISGTMMPTTYAASASQVPDWQGRMPQQQQPPQGFAHRSDSQELPKQQPQQDLWQPSAPVTQQSPWKPEQKQEQRQPEQPAKTVHAQQQQQQQQWQMERQTQPSQMLPQNSTWISVLAPQTNQAVQQQAQQKLLLQQQQAPADSGRTDSAQTSQVGGVFSKPHAQPEDGPLAWGTKTASVVSHILSPSKAAEHERSPLSVFWGSTSTSVQPQTTTGTVPLESGSIISPKPNEQELKLSQPQLPKSSTSIQTTQPGSTSLPSKDDTNLWSYKIPISLPQTIQDQLSSGTDKQQRQQTPGSANQSLATNQTSIIDPSRVPPGTENTRWTFQATSGIPKPLLTPEGSAVEQLQQQLQQPPQLMHLQQQKLQLQQQQQQQLQLQQQLQQQQQQLQLQQQQLQLQQQLQQQQQQQQQHLQLHQQQQQQQQQLQLQQQQQIQLQQQQQKQTSIASTWVNPPTSSQMNPITIQYGPPRFPHGEAPAVWGFQTSPPVSQTLLTGPIQQGSVRAQTQLPLMTGPQIIINQTPPFLSPALRPLPPLGLPAPHPLHSVSVNQIPRPPPQNLFFNPQGILGDGPPLPQTRPFSQLTPRTELPNLTGRLPFPTDRRQCVVCGCSFSQELELQMHYMQHAKGEI